MHAQAFNQLESIRSIKKSQLENYLVSLKSSLQILSEDPYASIAVKKFTEATESSGVDGPEWQQLEQQYAKHFGSTNEINAWYDLFLIDLEGRIVFTVAKESDLGMNVTHSKLSDTSINEAFQQAKQSDLGSIVVSDFKPYPPSNNDPAAFIMTKKSDELGNHIGYIALQFPINKVNEIMQQRDGMGETGETYLVGEDKRMRSDSFLDPTGHSIAASFAGTVEKNGVDTVAVTQAFKGESASKIIIDYNGNPVLSSYTTVDLGTFKWALIVEIDEAEAFQTANALIKISSITIIIVSLVIIGKRIAFAMQKILKEQVKPQHTELILSFLLTYFLESRQAGFTLFSTLA